MVSFHPRRASRRRAALALVACALVPTYGVSAAGTDIAVSTLGGGTASPLVTLLKLVVALSVVLLAFWVCARLMRRLNGVGVGGGAQAGLRIVGALSLGHRERLVVVQAGEEQVLLGVTASRIERLHLLARPLATPAASTDPGDFRAKLLAAMHRQVSS